MAAKKYAPSRTPDALSEWAYRRIHAMVVGQTFPLNQRISETRLGAELGVSRTPVREAIRRLVEDGLLLQRPSSGTYVVQLCRREIRDVYEVRLALETMAAGKAARRMKSIDVRRLMLSIKEMNQAIRRFRDGGDPVIKGPLLSRFHEADRAFHQLILHAAGNRFAEALVSKGKVKEYIYGERTHRRDLHHLARMWLLHARVARAIRARDAATARLRMAKLVRTGMRDALTRAT